MSRRITGLAAPGASCPTDTAARDYKAEFRKKAGRELGVPATWPELQEIARFFQGRKLPDGKVINGRIVNLAGDSVRVQTDMLKPGDLTGVDRKQIEEIVESKISMMPKGLLNTLNQDEVLDLMAYMLSRGDRKHAMFKK